MSLTFRIKKSVKSAYHRQILLVGSLLVILFIADKNVISLLYNQVKNSYFGSQQFKFQLKREIIRIY